MSKETRPKLYVVEQKIIKIFNLFLLEKIKFIFFKSKKIQLLQIIKTYRLIILY